MMDEKTELQKQVEDRIIEAKQKKILELAVGILVLEGKLGNNVLFNDNRHLIDLDDSCCNYDKRKLKELQREIVPYLLEIMSKGCRNYHEGNGCLDCFTDTLSWSESKGVQRGKTHINHLEISVETYSRKVSVPFYFEGEYDYSCSGRSLSHNCEIKDIDKNIIVYNEEYTRRGIDDIVWRPGNPKRNIIRYIPGIWAEQLRKAFVEKSKRYFEAYEKRLEEHDRFRIEFLRKEEEMKREQLEKELKERFGLGGKSR